MPSFSSCLKKITRVWSKHCNNKICQLYHDSSRSIIVYKTIVALFLPCLVPFWRFHQTSPHALLISQSTLDKYTYLAIEINRQPIDLFVLHSVECNCLHAASAVHLGHAQHPFYIGFNANSLHFNHPTTCCHAKYCNTANIMLKFDLLPVTCKLWNMSLLIEA